MALRLYLDDCAFSHRLVQVLATAGHTVVAPARAGTTGAHDDVHLRYAAGNNLALLTKNCRDFLALHKQDNSHAGILAVYQDNDPGRDMTYQEIGLGSNGVTWRSQVFESPVPLHKPEA